MKKYLSYLALAIISISSSLSFAADPVSNYPNKPIRLVVGFSPGGQPIQ